MGSTAVVIETKGRDGSRALRFPPRGDRDARRRDDDLLVQRVRQGELKAFEELYRKHSSFVFGLALRMLSNRADAEDMLQEIFLQVYDRLPSFEGRSAFSTWLYRLSVNRCLDHLRSRGAKEQSRTDPITPEVSGPVSTGGLGKITAAELEAAIGELPPSSRAAFVLHHVAGYDHKEVGEILGVAVGTSKSLVHRARARLKGILSR